MRYRTLTSKFMYYAGISVYGIFAIFYMVVFELLIRANEFGGLIALSVVGGFWALQFMLINRKSIFLKIDTELEKVYFGNLFFSNECDYSQINNIKSSWIPQLYWIKIGTNKYNFFIGKLDLSELKKTLRIEK